jgi:hypothetical protein
MKFIKTCFLRKQEHVLKGKTIKSLLSYYKSRQRAFQSILQGIKQRGGFQGSSFTPGSCCLRLDPSLLKGLSGHNQHPS